MLLCCEHDVFQFLASSSGPFPLRERCNAEFHLVCSRRILKDGAGKLKASQRASQQCGCKAEGMARALPVERSLPVVLSLQSVAECCAQ